MLKLSLLLSIGKNIFYRAQRVKCLPAMRKTQVQFLGRENPLEKEMAIHTSTLAWKIPWMEEPDTVLRVAKSWTQLSDFTFTWYSNKEKYLYAQLIDLRIKDENKGVIKIFCLKAEKDTSTFGKGLWSKRHNKAFPKLQIEPI